MISSVRSSVFIMMVLLMGCESKPASVRSDPQKVALGQELYLAYGCAVCHGVSGDGKGVSAIQSTIRPTNFTDLKAYRHGTDSISIQHAVKFGIKEDDSVMPAFKHLTDEELDQISQFLISIQKTGT